MTEAMPFLQKAILLSYAPRSFAGGIFICLGELLSMRKDGFLCGINSP